MNELRVRFNEAVQTFESLLKESFWSPLADLLHHPWAVAQGELDVHCIHGMAVRSNDRFCLGSVLTGEIALFLPPRDDDGWCRSPYVEHSASDAHDRDVRITECPTRAAISGLYGVYGGGRDSLRAGRIAPCPQRLLAHLLIGVQVRIKCLAARARTSPGNSKMHDALREFEELYFPRMLELIAAYNTVPPLYGEYIDVPRKLPNGNVRFSSVYRCSALKEGFARVRIGWYDLCS